MALANSLALTLLAAVCSSSAPRLVPLALLLLAGRCEAAGTVCDNNAACSSGCPTGVYGTSLCDGTFTGTAVVLERQGLSGTIPPQLGDMSQLKELYLYSNSISGTIPPDTSKLSQLVQLQLYDNAISGTIPPETGKLSQLQSLSLEYNSISGTVPPDTSKLSHLSLLYLYDNDFSGTVPSQLNNLPLTSCRLGGTNHFACPLPILPDVCTSVLGSPECNYTQDFCGYAPAICDGTYTGTTLDLSNRSLTGSIPKQLGSFALTRIELEGNAFEYPADAARFDELKIALQRCRTGEASSGVPPTSCKAFAGVWIKDTSECVNCDSFRESMTVLIAGIAALALVALAALGWFAARILRHPTAMFFFKRWVSTVAIFVNQVQMLSLIGSLHLEWPRSIEIAALSHARSSCCALSASGAAQLPPARGAQLRRSHQSVGPAGRAGYER